MSITTSLSLFMLIPMKKMKNTSMTMGIHMADTHTALTRTATNTRMLMKKAIRSSIATRIAG